MAVQLFDISQAYQDGRQMKANRIQMQQQQKQNALNNALTAASQQYYGITPTQHQQMPQNAIAKAIGGVKNLVSNPMQTLKNALVGGQQQMPQPMQQPMQQQMPMRQMPQQPQQQVPTAQAPVQQDPNTVVVEGVRRQQPQAPQFQQNNNPYAQADYLDFMAKQALQNGGYAEFQEYSAAAQKARQDMSQQYNQSIAATLAPIARMQDNPETRDINEADEAFNQAMNMMPYTLPVEWQRLLSDPATRQQATQMLINMGNPEAAAKEAISTQGTYDQFRPYQTDNLGDRQGVFDPRTGQYISNEPFGLNPTQVRGQNITERNNIRTNATSSANSKRSTAASIANSQRSANIAIRGQNIRKEELQYNRSIGQPANVGGVNNDFTGEGWE